MYIMPMYNFCCWNKLASIDGIIWVIGELVCQPTFENCRFVKAIKVRGTVRCATLFRLG